MYLDYFPGRLKFAELGKSMRLTFWVPELKFVKLYHNNQVLLYCIDLSTNPDQGLKFNRTHPSLFQNMSVKIYTNFLLSLGVYNFKIDYLKNEMRHGMWVHIFLGNLASSSFQHEYYLCHRRSKCYGKAIKFYPEILEFKIFAWWWDALSNDVSNSASTRGACQTDPTVFYQNKQIFLSTLPTTGFNTEICSYLSLS